MAKSTKSIDTILAFHQGPIEAFELVLSVPVNCPRESDICRWVHHLSGLSIKELKFHIGYYNMSYDLGSCIFACQDLISLDLSHCSFILPSNFTGLKNLRNLVLRPALVAQDMLENFVSNCHQRMKLEITVSPPGHRFGIKHLKITALNLQHLVVAGWLNTVKIDAPNLQHLDLECCFLEDINVNTNCLLSVRLFDSVFEGPAYEKADVIYRYLLKLFARQSQLKYVDLDSCFIQYLCLSGFPDTLCNTLLHLKHLIVKINLRSVKEVSSTLCLLRSCPNLESIKFWHEDITGKGIVDDVNKFLQDNSSSCLFKHLKDVWVQWISYYPAETSFIKFVMSSSPILENVFRVDETAAEVSTTE